MGEGPDRDWHSKRPGGVSLALPRTPPVALGPSGRGRARLHPCRPRKTHSEPSVLTFPARPFHRSTVLRVGRAEFPRPPERQLGPFPMPSATSGTGAARIDACKRVFAPFVMAIASRAKFQPLIRGERGRLGRRTSGAKRLRCLTNSPRGPARDAMRPTTRSKNDSSDEIWIAT